MELRQLEAFVAVATELHFGRAAERLHMAAPTLSDLIRRLKRELGTPLFTRTTRRVAMTSAGAELLARTKVILDEVAAADAADLADGHVDNTVYFGSPQVSTMIFSSAQDKVRAAAGDRAVARDVPEGPGRRAGRGS